MQIFHSGARRFSTPSVVWSEPCQRR